MSSIIEKYREEQKAQAKRALERRLKKYQRKSLERGMRLVTPAKPHEGPCFAPRKVVAGFDKEGKPLFKEEIQQTVACSKYHVRAYQAAMELAVARVQATAEWRKAGIGADGVVDEAKREELRDELEGRAARTVDQKPYAWEWHPGRGLEAQEIDALLIKSYPVDTPEQRRRALGFLYSRRVRRPMHPDDFSAALERIEQAGKAA